ncbi:hypothetical protein [Neorhizobium alkalisoli]|uniref:hypothetical protein n=1 Tax=Neorhizobium alkalisoli TaxID=528178 RepID=UPI000CF91356|nr:hypothetical protein [Neorhizobium alkalisoli]
MVELREILKSKEVNDAVRAIEGLLSKRDWITKAATEKSFKDLALGKTFQASDVLKILLSPEPKYPGFKEVLAAGFVGWALFPETNGLSVNFMTHAILEHLDDAELEAGFADQPVTLARDIVARYVLVGFDFLADIYHPFGGYQAFTRHDSKDSVDILFDAEAKKINTVVRAMTYLHYGADRYQDPEFDFAPSLNRAVTVLAEWKKRLGDADYKQHYVSRSLLHQRWSESKQTVALVYAASTVKVGRKSLLQIISAGDFHYREHQKQFATWVGRARYVSDHVFAKMDPNHLQRTTMRILAGVEPQPFAPPRINDDREERIIAAQFRKKFRNPSVN